MVAVVLPPPATTGSVLADLRPTRCSCSCRPWWSLGLLRGGPLVPTLRCVLSPFDPSLGGSPARAWQPTWRLRPESTYCAKRESLSCPRFLCASRRCASVAVGVATVAATRPLSFSMPTMANVLTEWGPPSVMPAYSCLPEPVLDRLCHHPAMAAGCRGCGLLARPVCSWSDVELAALLEEERTGSLLAADAAASGTYVAPSTVHGLGVFAARAISAGEHILPFYGQLVYEDLEATTPPGGAADQASRYGPSRLPRALCCTTSTWQRNALELEVHQDFWADAERRPWPTHVATYVATKQCFYRSRMTSSDPVWVVPAPFCAAGLVNDPRRHGESNAKFLQQPLPVHTKEQLVLPWTAHLEVTQDIAVGEEILVGYGDVYAWFDV